MPAKKTTGEPPQEVKKTETVSTKASDDNVMAALAHALALVAPVIAPLIIWIIYKDKSRYVKNQSMQALIFQLAGFVVIGACFMIFFVFAFATMGLGSLCFPVLFIPMLGVLGYSLYAALKCYKGEDFKYPVIADFVGKM
ncbi:MAG: DUF4870 domain-containing protein [Candidatus Altiarchaeota archaeon]|nr:DUF4870 domain-containing protein [Candidatus Altiarchaeota archaeon]